MEHYVKEEKANLLRMRMTSLIRATIARNASLFDRFVCVHADIAADTQKEVTAREETQA